MLILIRFNQKFSFRSSNFAVFRCKKMYQAGAWRIAAGGRVVVPGRPRWSGVVGVAVASWDMSSWYLQNFLSKRKLDAITCFQCNICFEMSGNFEAYMGWWRITFENEDVPTGCGGRIQSFAVRYLIVCVRFLKTAIEIHQFYFLIRVNF